jgi:mono/diheme cytochrome c family protein
MATMSRSILAIAVVLVAGAGHVTAGKVSGNRALSPQTAANAPDSKAAADRALLDKYCVTCHNERLRTGGLALETLDVNEVASQADVWEKVVRKVRAGQMPPVGRPRPEAAQAAAFTSSLETRLDRASERSPNPGRPTVHRLNRTEYANSVRDLLALEIDARNLLPADDTDAHGFDNNADVLTVSPALTARYLSAARKISRLAVGRAVAPTIETYRLPRELVQDERLSERLPFGSRGGAAIEHYFPLDGEYVIKIRLQTNNYEYVKGLADEHDIEVRLDRERVKAFMVGGAKEGAPPASWGGTVYGTPAWEKYALQAHDAFEVRFATKAGRREVGVSFIKKAWEPEDIRQPRQGGWPLSSDEMFDSNPGIASITIEGPYATAGPSDTPSRRRIFTCQAKANTTASTADDACAKSILTTIARRAYRRPVTDKDIRTLMEFYDTGKADGGLEGGIQLALERVLVSPDFLFRIENDETPNRGTNVYALTDVELASRLSFFLWSSIPDDQLLDVAAKGHLKDPKILEQQVRRMMADPRSQALVDNFAGQWLVLRNVRTAAPDPDLFPDFDDNLREAFQRETELFFESQLHEDRSVIELLSANYSFLNERLARHYGIDNVYGDRFRRVTFTDGRRGGILSHGSLLTVTSYPNRTSPVLRGKWLLETILGTPPPPPPPDVPALADRGEGGKLASVRERLERHRQNPACSGCHSIMDPLGFALENFDAVGRWRTADAGATVDASGALPGGATFKGPAGLRDILIQRKDQFAANVTEKLLAYALGRGIEYYDLPAVRKISNEAAPDNYRWSSIILGIVKSTPFQMRRSDS